MSAPERERESTPRGRGRRGLSAAEPISAMADRVDRRARPRNLEHGLPHARPDDDADQDHVDRVSQRVPRFRVSSDDVRRLERGTSAGAAPTAAPAVASTESVVADPERRLDARAMQSTGTARQRSRPPPRPSRTIVGHGKDGRSATTPPESIPSRGTGKHSETSRPRAGQRCRRGSSRLRGKVAERGRGFGRHDDARPDRPGRRRPRDRGGIFPGAQWNQPLPAPAREVPAPAPKTRSHEARQEGQDDKESWSSSTAGMSVCSFLSSGVSPILHRSSFRRIPLRSDFVFPF